MRHRANYLGESNSDSNDNKDKQESGIVKGITSIINPIAKAGVSAFSTKLQTEAQIEAAKKGGSMPSAAVMPPQSQSQGSTKTMAIVALGGLAIIVVMFFTMGGNSQSKPAQ